jgi:hypothetical protein
MTRRHPGPDRHLPTGDLHDHTGSAIEPDGNEYGCRVGERRGSAGNRSGATNHDLVRRGAIGHQSRLRIERDPVPDDIWNEAARHHDELQLAGLVLQVAKINRWNRLNIATRQQAGVHSW